MEINRRNLVGLLGGVTTASALFGASQASAQTNATESTWDKIMRTKKLRVGVVATGAPWTVKDITTGEWRGHFYVLAKALAEDMQVELVPVETTWGNATMDLQADKIDLMFGMNLTPVRALAVDFTDKVYDSALIVIARPNFVVDTWEDMNNPNCRIAVDVGSAHDHIASRLCPNANILRFKTVDDAMLNLRSGRADVQCLFWMGAVRAVKRTPELGKAIVPKPLFGNSSHGCIRPEQDKRFRDFLNLWIQYSRGIGLIRTAVLDSLQEDGLSFDDIPQGVVF